MMPANELSYIFSCLFSVMFNRSIKSNLCLGRIELCDKDITAGVFTSGLL